MTGDCLGDVVAALVDGELDHAGRERAHRHLAHCAACRAEVAAQRRLKARLSGEGPPEPGADLTERLLRLAGQLQAPAQPGPLEVRPLPSRPPVAGRPAGRTGTARPARPPRSRPVLRRWRVSTGSAVALLGVAAALALGAPPPRTAPGPVGSAADAVAPSVTTVAGSRPAVLPAMRTARVAPLVPLRRSVVLAPAGGRPAP